MNSLKGDENHALCLDCASTVARGCVNCNSAVSPSKFKIQSRSCTKCLERSQGSTSSLDTLIFKQFADTISSAEAAGSERICSHEDLLPMVMGYRKNTDGHIATYMYYRTLIMIATHRLCNSYHWRKAHWRLSSRYTDLHLGTATRRTGPFRLGGA